MEQMTGITAKNIRFYEQAGLLSPRRGDNRYREYSNQDLRRLKLIKLLRKLDLPLEEIKRLLEGGGALEEAMAAQRRRLEMAEQQLRSAQKLCAQLEKEPGGVTGLDVEGYLEQIEKLESRGERFMSIINDFKTVARADRKKRITFYPDELINTPREFTHALLEYARSQGREIVITRESINPEFTLDGVEYEASRVMGRYSHRVIATMKHPEQAGDNRLPKNRRMLLSALRSLLPGLTLVAVGILLNLTVGLSAASMFYGLGFVLLISIGFYR